MLTLKRFILSAIFIATISCVFAQQATFSLMQPRSVIEGRNFTITFRLSNGDANPPAAPQLENCTLLYGPAQSTMQSTQYINGKMSSSFSIDYTFTYRADKAGTVVVPAVAVSCEGKMLRSNSASFNILPQEQSSQQNPAQNQPQRHPQDIQSGNGNQIAPDDILVRVFFSKSSVYEQEPVVATIKVYTKYDITSFVPTTQPAFEGFLCEELPVPNESTMEHYNGKNYYCAVLKRLLLYPQKSGKLTVNSGKYDITLVLYETVNMGFFRTNRPVERDITTSSNAASLTVKALPQPQPDGFNGAVGKFNVETSLEPELMRTNEASVYTYTITGTGNINYLSSPQIDFPAGIDAYSPKPEFDTRLTPSQSNMTGTFKTDYTIVPQEMGNFTIEGKPLVYFNPESGEYVTINVPDMPIKVLRGNSAPIGNEQNTIEGNIDDIFHIHPVKADQQKKQRSYAIYSWTYWITWTAAALILVAIALVYRRQIRLQADVSGRKLAKAGRIANKRLKVARGFMDSHKNDEFYASLAKALWGYISDKLSIPASQLTRDNVAEKLLAYGVPQDSVDSIIQVLDNCEMARFTPDHSDSEIANIYTQAVSAIKSIEDVKNR